MSIVRGNDEKAFFLRSLGGDEVLADVCSAIHYRVCPLRCKFPNTSDIGVSRTWDQHIKQHKEYRILLEHLLRPDPKDWFMKGYSHDQRSSRRYNLSFGILQQLVIYQTRKKGADARAISLYKLNSEYGLSLQILSFMIGKPMPAVAYLATNGMMIERQNDMPTWVTNVLAATETTDNRRDNSRDGSSEEH